MFAVVFHGLVVAKSISLPVQLLDSLTSRLLLVELALVYVPLVLVLLLDKCAHFLSLLQLFEVD